MTMYMHEGFGLRAAAIASSQKSLAYACKSLRGDNGKRSPEINWVHGPPPYWLTEFEVKRQLQRSDTHARAPDGRRVAVGGWPLAVSSNLGGPGG